jgi:hypothetical protein
MTNDGKFKHRIYRVDERVFRVNVDNPSAPAEVHVGGEWRALVLSTEEVLTIMNARELTPEEIDRLGLA